MGILDELFGGVIDTVLNNKVVSLTTENSSLKVAISKLNTSIKNLQAELGGYQTSKTFKEQDMTALQEQIQSLRSKTSTLKSQLDIAHKNVGSLSSDLSERNSRISSLNQKISELEIRLHNSQELEKRHKSQADQLQQVLSSIQGLLPGTPVKFTDPTIAAKSASTIQVAVMTPINEENPDLRPKKRKDPYPAKIIGHISDKPTTGHTLPLDGGTIVEQSVEYDLSMLPDILNKTQLKKVLKVLGVTIKRTDKSNVFRLKSGNKLSSAQTDLEIPLTGVGVGILGEVMKRLGISIPQFCGAYIRSTK